MRTLIVGAAISASVPILSALAEFDPAAIADWRAWAVGIGAGSVRQVAIYLTSALAQRRGA